ncbi:MAG: cobalt-precorrin-5B (C(1))-methyltransferase [Gammaproteobacteria bacterium]|nr:cobalt-precorrin-5B (C(1))-methyltransferase [Gammaproteobacteria bacterium]MDD9815914.1 cobalt-precorrin-5B (C(1))-methyltransferase [Gammaproteobacteria bacterium]
MPPAATSPLRYGWTTGACAAAAAKAAYTALLCGRFAESVGITLPRGEKPVFALAEKTLGDGFARAGIVKDAGDDPDVTHGALIVAEVRAGGDGDGVVFRGGGGVGTVTLAGLPLAVGEPAINPAPRRMIHDAVAEVAASHGGNGDAVVTISVPGGAALAARTWNPRLGIVGGISILGTTGVVVPFSCSAWIHSIHRGIDVARANGRRHVAGCTGATSEKTVRELYALRDEDLLDMGDFAGGLLKYLKKNPLPRLTIGGGFGKLSKLAMGCMDLHSARSQVDLKWLGGEARALGGGALGDAVAAANSANHALQLCAEAEVNIAARVAQLARASALSMLGGETVVDVVVVDRGGAVIGKSDG